MSTKNVFLEKIVPCIQSLLIIWGSIVNIIGGTYKIMNEQDDLPIENEQDVQVKQEKRLHAQSKFADS